MYGNWGRFLRVNLSTGEVKVEEYGEEFAKKWLGSRGLAIYLLLKGMDPKADPLGPENKLILTPRRQRRSASRYSH
jgi:aldehyde:ferredoxin oxidoreductase